VLVEWFELGQGLVTLPHPQISPESVKLKAHPAERPGEARHSEPPNARHGDRAGSDESEHDKEGEGERDKDQRRRTEGADSAEGFGCAVICGHTYDR
jgi:hypothetical protein